MRWWRITHSRIQSASSPLLSKRFSSMGIKWQQYCRLCQCVPSRSRCAHNETNKTKNRTSGKHGTLKFEEAAGRYVVDYNRINAALHDASDTHHLLIGTGVLTDVGNVLEQIFNHQPAVVVADDNT